MIGRPVLKKKKVTMADTLRMYGLPEKVVKYGKQGLRYQSPVEKGVYWYFFSLYVRNRDVRMYGACISCGRKITVDSCDAGHFMPAANCGRDLLFDERNVNAECSQCNAWDDTHLLGYAEGLDMRYGDGTAAKLRQRKAEYSKSPRVKDWSPKEYAEKILELKKLSHL